MFIGYDSLKGRAIIHARKMLSFLAEVISQPQNFSNERLYDLCKRPSFKYEKVIVVGHSLGGALLRRMAIDSHAPAHTEWQSVGPQISHMLLFAPAHKGSNALHLFEQTQLQGNLGGPLSVLRSWIQFKVSVLQDLKPTSTFIKTLTSETEALLSSGKGGWLIASKVYFGDEENIVEPEDFCRDPAFMPLNGRDHVSICKTRVPTYKPFLDLVNLI
jgi:pimeloyl-ACP methyl ester carboxylesterase